MLGCWPIATPSTLSWVEEIADRYAFNDRYEYPCSCKSARKFTTSFTGEVMGSVFRSSHQLTHFLKSESYDFATIFPAMMQVGVAKPTLKFVV